MATAVQPNKPVTTSNPRTKLVLASIAGAAFLLIGIGVAAYAIPLVWAQSVSPVVAPLGSLVDAALKIVAQLTAIAVFVWAGSLLAGASPPPGIRGGIFLVISAAIAIFFIVRAVGLKLEDSSMGLPITLVVLGALLGLTYRGLASDRGEAIMHTLENEGLLSLFTYKRTQGLKARRYTLIGLLIVGWSGVYSLISHQMLDGNWDLPIPFTNGFTLTLLTDLGYSVPLLLGIATFWIAWRAVNAPSFADFLIATEAEMNKVSWSTRKRLVQDTIVVLITVLLLTVFLFTVDLFWSWLLSRPFIGVLPPKTQTTGAVVDSVQGKKVDW